MFNTKNNFNKMKNTNKAIAKAFNTFTRSTDTENVFIPYNGVNHEHRKQFFNNFNEDLLKRVITIKTNAICCQKK